MMKTVNIAGVEFGTELGSNNDPYIVAVFGEENVGKTRFPLTGPEVIAYVPLEMKTYATVAKDAAELGKKVFLPTKPEALLVPKRKVDMMKDNVERQKFYREHVEKVKGVVYAMLEQ